LEFCKRCERVVREDDSLTQGELDGQKGCYCRDCRGLAAPVYPVGRPVPQTGDGMARRDIRICACCRTALRWDEPQTAMRLLPEDVRQEVHPPVTGALLSCPACVARWKPIIHARLIAAGILAPGVALTEMTREDLL